MGEALISFLDQKGTPGIVQRALIVPPASRVGPITQEERQKVIQGSVLCGHYEKAVDRESAYERLTNRADQRAATAPQPVMRGGAPAGGPEPTSTGGGMWDKLGGAVGGVLTGTTGRGGYQRQGLMEAMAKSAVRSVGSQLGRQIMRGLMGSIMGGSRR